MLSATKHLDLGYEILRFAQDDMRALRMTTHQLDDIFYKIGFNIMWI
jgi:hypothetical protein